MESLRIIRGEMAYGPYDMARYLHHSHKIDIYVNPHKSQAMKF